MKRKLVLLFQPACVCVLAACVMEDKPEWQDQVTGTYTAQYEQPYSTGYDTLFISKMPSAPGRYHLLRHTAYRRKGGNYTEASILRTENRVAVPDKTRPLLHIVPSGRELWFDERTGQLTTGTTTYHRIQ